MSTPPRRIATVLVALLVALAGLAGCVTVPTAGPVERVEGQQPTCQNCVNVEVAPPAAGDQPGQIVEGYLRANSNYQPNYSVAKQYLTRSAAEKWSPEDGASIYTGKTEATGDSVTLRGSLVGFLGSDRTYTARSQQLNWDFGLVQENGQWRISTPPGGLMVAQFSFASFYKPYDLFFVGNSQSLVPQSIYLPSLRNPANVASALVKALLNGPSRWLSPAVSTAVPQNTTLSVDSVTISDGTAQVPLSAELLQLTDARRTLLAAQLVYTLKQVSGVKRVLLQVNSQPFRVPESEADTLAVPIEAVSRELDPIPFVAADQLYAVRDDVVQRVSAGSDVPEVDNLPGALGDGRYNIDSLAVSVANTDLALVTDNRTVLRRSPTSESDVTTLLDDVSDLLRPSFSRSGEIWAVGNRDGRQQMWVATASAVVSVTAPDLKKGRVVAFRVSPDGSRMALLLRTSSGTQLGLLRILRSDADTVTVDGWRVLDTSAVGNQPRIADMRDVAWTDATNLMVLSAADTDARYAPTRISDDASRILADPESNEWSAVQLTVLLRTQTTIVVADNRKTYRDDGTQWREFLSGITTIAYPG